MQAQQDAEEKRAETAKILPHLYTRLADTEQQRWAALNERAMAEAAMSSGQQLQMILQQKQDADKGLDEWKLKAEAAAKGLAEERARAKARQNDESLFLILLSFPVAFLLLQAL